MATWDAESDLLSLEAQDLESPLTRGFDVDAKLVFDCTASGGVRVVECLVPVSRMLVDAETLRSWSFRLRGHMEPAEPSHVRGRYRLRFPDRVFTRESHDDVDVDIRRDRGRIWIGLTGDGIPTVGSLAALSSNVWAYVVDGTLSGLLVELTSAPTEPTR